MALVHHMRSVIQGRLIADDRYELSPRYVDFGRVEVADRETGDRYLLRSSRAASIEKSTSSDQGSLFAQAPFLRRTDLTVLIYDFAADGLRLSTAAGMSPKGSSKVRIAGSPEPAAFLAYEGDDDGDQGVFRQGAVDAFRDLGDLGELDGTAGDLG